MIRKVTIHHGEFSEADELRATVLAWVDGWLGEVGDRELFAAGEVGDRLLDLRRVLVPSPDGA